MDAAIRALTPFSARVGGPLARAAVVLAAVLGIALVTISVPVGLRALLALGLVANLLLVGTRWPRAAAVAALLFLPFMALVRRLLIDESPWVSFDPLLLVAPLTAAFLVYRTHVWSHRPLPRDLIGKLVLVVLGIALAGALNPLNPAPTAGFVGLLFVAVPLLWFFVGRELGGGRRVELLLLALVGIATAIAAYGWAQSHGDIASWDDAWLRIAGYATLTVDNKIRAFGTLSSSFEYAQVVGVGMVVALAFALHRRPHMFLFIPLLAPPLWLAAVRGGIVYTLMAMVVVLALRTRRPALAALGTAAGIAFFLGVVIIAKPALVSAADSTGNALVIRNVEGITSPFDEDKSTAAGHVTRVYDGILQSPSNPVGQGTGSINIASQKLGGEGSEKGTEMDISNAFLAFGPLGGLVYAALVVAVFVAVIRRYMSSGDPVLLATTGILIVTLGSWLSGGLYFITALVWFLVGSATRPEEQPEAAPPVHAAVS